MLVVAEVDHQHVELHEDVKMFFGQTEERCSTLHVAHDTVGVGGTFHEELACTQQKVQLVSDQLLTRKFSEFCHYEKCDVVFVLFSKVQNYKKNIAATR